MSWRNLPLVGLVGILFYLMQAKNAIRNSAVSLKNVNNVHATDDQLYSDQVSKSVKQSVVSAKHDADEVSATFNRAQGNGQPILGVRLPPR